MITVLGMGQSNATGRGTNGEFVIDAGVTAWNSENDIETTANLGTAFVTPDRAQRPFVSSYNSPLIHACKYLKRATGEDVRLIMVCMPGRAIAAWMAADGTKGAMYTRMAAVLAAAGVTDVDAFIWQQGETDDTSGAGTYTAKWNKLLEVMTTEGYITADTPVAVTSPPAILANINPVFETIAASSDRVGIARVSTFPLLDTIHYSGVFAPRIGFEQFRALSDTETDLGGALRIPDFGQNDFLLGDNVTGERRRADAGDAVPQRNWVYGVGYDSFSIPSSSTFTTVPLKPRFGQRALISGGAFVPDRSGIWKIQAKGYAGGNGTAVSILDRSGAEMERIGYQPTGNAIVTGATYLDLSEGDPIYLGVRQTGGSTVDITYDGVGPTYFALEAIFMGAEGSI